MTAVVVDSGSGIGRACARRFGREGVDVVAIGPSAGEIDDTCSSIRRSGGRGQWRTTFSGR